jgi:hypothetical protein
MSNTKYINNVLYKYCIKCDNWLEANDQNFYVVKSGFSSYCKPCNIKRTEEWKKNNPDKIKIYNTRRNHKPDRIENAKVRNRKSRENGYYASWQKNNPEKVKEYQMKRAHKNHNITKREWNFCKEYFDYRCAYCGLHISEHYKKYKGISRPSDFHKEHVDHNGENDLSNCVPSCNNCNSFKHDFLFDDWYNLENPNYSKERYNKILQWLNNDYKLFSTP